MSSKQAGVHLLAALMLGIWAYSTHYCYELFVCDGDMEGVMMRTGLVMRVFAMRAGLVMVTWAGLVIWAGQDGRAGAGRVMWTGLMS